MPPWRSQPPPSSGPTRFPRKPIRWVIPFAPGGNYDVTSRIVAEPMGRQLGQTVLIDNRPGAGGVVGLEAAVDAPADGYTIVMASFTVGYVAPIFAGKQQMLQVLAPVSMLTTAPTLVVTRSDSRFTDMKALLAEAKAKPGTVTMGHSGNGTTNHVAILRLQLNEKVKFNIIPYRGSGPGIADLLAGNDRLLRRPAHQLDAAHPVGQAARPGEFRPRADSRPARRADAQGSRLHRRSKAARRRACSCAWRRRSRSIDRLNDGVVAGLKDEAANKRLRELGAIVRPSTPEQFTEALKADEANVSELLKIGALKPE